MPRPETLSIACGLLSALAWGAGDFAGGLASRRGSALTVVFFAQIIGAVLLLLGAVVFSRVVPPAGHLLAAALAGIAGVLGLVALYQGLAQGRMGLVAPLSAVVAALVPMLFAFFLEGAPGRLQLVGFGLAVAAVWLLSSPGGGSRLATGELRLSLLAGLGFGLFFTLMDQASSQAVLWPLVAARGAAIAVMFGLMTVRRQLAPPPVGQFGFITLAGVLDVAGNGFFGLAAHLGRLDIAAVLASLYPASTVLLAWLVFRERLGKGQWIGVVMAGIALVLIAV